MSMKANVMCMLLKEILVANETPGLFAIINGLHGKRK